MTLKKELAEKNNFLKKAYGYLREVSPSSPLSAWVDPFDFGKSIGHNDDETTRIMYELVNDRFVTSSIGMGMLMVTQKGLNYLRELEVKPTSPVIQIKLGGNSVINSPNTNIVNQSSNVTISQNFGEIGRTINQIRENIKKDNTIDDASLKEIYECLNEIEQNIKSGNKPKFAIKSLIDITGGISSIASFGITLGQLAGIIPPIP